MFWPRFLRLLLSIFAEALYNLGGLIGFLFTRRRTRDRISALMRHAGRGAVLVVVVVCLTVVAGGCCSHPGASFGAQVDNFAWSFETLWRMDEALPSLQEDLITIFDPELGELGDTFCQLGW